VVLKSTGSEFTGFLVDEMTTLQPTQDRVLATSLTVRWRYVGTDVARAVDWDEAYANIKALLLARFATVHSKALQQTLWEMGRAVLEARDDVAEVRLVAPNRHHFLVDLAAFDRQNEGEVFHADDRPYGLITAVVERDDTPPAPEPGRSGRPEGSGHGSGTSEKTRGQEHRWTSFSRGTGTRRSHCARSTRTRSR
jgi:urate oxidase